MLRGEFINVNTYIKNDDRCQITKLNFKKPEKEEHKTVGNNKD